MSSIAITHEFFLKNELVSFIIIFCAWVPKWTLKNNKIKRSE